MSSLRLREIDIKTPFPINLNRLPRPVLCEQPFVTHLKEQFTIELLKNRENL